MSDQERNLFYENQRFYREYMVNANNIPPGHKLVATDYALDSWIAAHYEFPNGKLPNSRPRQISEHVFDRLKHYYGKDRASLELKER